MAAPRALLLDINGVLLDEDGPIADAAETLTELRRRGAAAALRDQHREPPPRGPGGGAASARLCAGATRVVHRWPGGPQLSGPPPAHAAGPGASGPGSVVSAGSQPTVCCWAMPATG